MHIGDFEQILLFAVLRLGDNAHGAAVRDEIERRIDRVVSPGAAYTALDRLEERGFVTSSIGETAPGRGGRRRKFYRVSPAGARALERSYSDLRSMAAGLLSELNGLAERG
jgi:PadR family transcriptional regulator PadR